MFYLKIYDLWLNKFLNRLSGAATTMECVQLYKSPSNRRWWHYASFRPWISACYWQIRQIPIRFWLSGNPALSRKSFGTSQLIVFRQSHLVYIIYRVITGWKTRSWTVRPCNTVLKDSPYSDRTNVSQANAPFKKLAIVNLRITQYWEVSNWHRYGKLKTGGNKRSDNGTIQNTNC